MQSCQIFGGPFDTQQYFSLCQRPVDGSEKHGSTFLNLLHDQKCN